MTPCFSHTLNKKNRHAEVKSRCRCSEQGIDILTLFFRGKFRQQRGFKMYSVSNRLFRVLSLLVFITVNKSKCLVFTELIIIQRRQVKHIVPKRYGRYGSNKVF